MTPKELVINFVIQYRKPFSAEIVAGMTDLNLSEVETILKGLIKKQMIKCISESQAIYVYAFRNEITKHNQKRSDWVYNLKDCRDLIKLLTNKRLTSVRTIAHEFGKSRQWVFLYLEALASIDALGMDQDGYFINPKADLTKFGAVIKPGIISQLRENYHVIKVKKAKEDKDKKLTIREIRKQTSERWSAWMKSREID